MNKGIEQLKRDEGFGPKAYKDTEDIWTIGYGRNLEANPLKLNEVIKLFEMQPMTKEQANYLQQNDVQVAMLEAERKFPWIKNFSEPRRWVVYNMLFNMGLPTFLRFKNTIKFGEKGDHDGFSKEMMDSKWGRAETRNRALRLSKQMLTGEWQ